MAPLQGGDKKKPRREPGLRLDDMDRWSNAGRRRLSALRGAVDATKRAPADADAKERIRALGDGAKLVEMPRSAALIGHRCADLCHCLVNIVAA